MPFAPNGGTPDVPSSGSETHDAGAPPVGGVRQIVEPNESEM